MIGTVSQTSPGVPRVVTPGSVLVVDDRRLFADAIGSALEASGSPVAGVAYTLDEAIRIVHSERPAVAIITLGSASKDPEQGFRVAKRVLIEEPTTRVIGVVAPHDARAIERARVIGVLWFVTKHDSITRLLWGIDELMRGGRVGDVAAQSHVESASRPNVRANDPLLRQLTDREMEVLELLAEGCSGVEMTERLGISSNTVRSHVQHILYKLQVHSRLEAAAYAVHRDLFHPTGESYRSVRRWIA